MTNLHLAQWLPWLADAPLFIDEAQVATMYDAIVRPEYASESLTIDLSAASATEKASTIGGEASLGLGGMLARLFPSLTLSAERSSTQIASEESGLSIDLRPVDNPYRQLLHLLIHYLANQPDRLIAIDDQTANWPGPEVIAAAPRAVVVLDLSPGALLLPMAAEGHEGGVHLIYPSLVPSDAPRYPTGAASDEELADLRREYWRWFLENYDAQRSMVAVEEAAGTLASRLEWIDYRLALWDGTAPAETAHMHICGRGAYDTGTFAYNLVKRGYKHGLRIIGTLKSEPDINVLAVFEK